MTIVKLEKNSFDIYYDILLKYPVVVIEKFNGRLQDSGINREKLGEPFKKDPLLSRNNSFTKSDYIKYMKHGGSYGHNAPAGFHKNSIEDYKSTFLFSNISPQEVVFNSGLWVLLENFCKKMINKYKKVVIITGNIKGRNRQIEDININIPKYMFKILFIYHEGKIYNYSFVMENKPHYKNYEIDNYNTSITKIKNLLSKMNFDLTPIINNITDANKIYNLKKIEKIHIELNDKLVKQMKSSQLYGKIIYQKTTNGLEKLYQKEKENFGYYHKIYYKLAKQKLNNLN